MVAAEKPEKLTGADAKFGYEFGCDGYMRLADVCKLLSIAPSTAWRRVQDGKLRSATMPGIGLRYCKRSVELLKKEMKAYETTGQG